MVKHAAHHSPQLDINEDDKATERSYRPVVAGWTREVNGREFGHFLEMARIPPKRSYVGLPVADPLSRWAYLWGTVATVTDMTFTAFIVPLSVAFNDYGQFGAYWVMDYIGSIIYILDLIFEFHIGFIVRWDQSAITITDGHQVAKHYIVHGTFWIDFVASLPIITQIAFSASGLSDDALQALGLLKLLRLVRVLKVLGRMNRVDSGGFLHQWLSVRFNSVALLCWNLAYSLMVMINLIACLWWWTAVAQGVENSWVAVVQITKPNMDLENSGDWPRWLLCAYYALVTMATIGYGDIVPVTTFEVGMVFILVLAGVAYFGFVLSTVSAIMTMRTTTAGDSGPAVEKYQAMETWMRRFSVSRRLQTDIRRYIFSHASAGVPTARDAQFYHALPLWLKVRIAEDLQATAIASLLGGNRGTEALSKECLARVAQITALTSDTVGYRPGERLHRAGDPITQILFLEEGEIGLFVPGVVRPVKVSAPAVLGAGALFAGRPGGELCSTWNSTARAITSVLLWSVDAVAFTRQMAQSAPEGLLAMMQHYQHWTKETVKKMEEIEAANAAAAAGAVAAGTPADKPADAAALGPGLRLAIGRYRERAEVSAAAVQEMVQLVKMVQEDEAHGGVGPLPVGQGWPGASEARVSESGAGDVENGASGEADYDDVEGQAMADYDDLEGQAMAAEEQLERDKVRQQVNIQRAERGAEVLRAMMLAGVLRRQGEVTFVA